MHPADIQARLKKRGITQKEIADELGVTEVAVSKVINKSSVSDRIMKAVARGIGEDHRAVFPEYYFGKSRRRKAA
ncbi:MAG: helix-turn-helix domain-containing protein [Deltaproteobacteria bacterium]|nr:helix-turn-helix domain-containing protein [Deltaproteobacteria bacterium]